MGRAIRAALGTGLGDPLILDVPEAESEQLERLTVEEALQFLIRKSNGHPTARVLRSILRSNTAYEAQVNGRDVDPKTARVQDHLAASGRDPVEELNLKVTERQSGG